jgi:Protein of unknown function (DUF3108)
MTTMRRWTIWPIILPAAPAVLVVVAACGDQALAQSRLEAGYTITFARIPVGNIVAAVELGASEYTMSAAGHAGIRSLLTGEAAFATRGAVKDGHAIPVSFTSRIASGDESLNVTMVLNDGTVEKLMITPQPADPQAGGNRIPVTDADRRGILDPLSAFLLPDGVVGTSLSQDACQRTLPIFDGLQRYDLRLAYKRMDNVAASKGYAGPALVCSVSYQAISGHSPSTPLVKYLTEGREMEIAFAPVAGTRTLAPFRVSVMSMLANLVIRADRFVSSGPAVDAPPANSRGQQ